MSEQAFTHTPVPLPQPALARRSVWCAVASTWRIAGISRPGLPRVPEIACFDPGHDAVDQCLDFPSRPRGAAPD